EAARKMMIASRHAFEPPAREIAVVKDVTGPVPMRLYDVRAERGPAPLLLFIHGGGWVIGDLETHEPFCIDLAIELDLPVAAVDSACTRVPLPGRVRGFARGDAVGRLGIRGAGSDADRAVPRWRQ